MKKLLVLLLLIQVGLVFSQSKTLRQRVHNWVPGYDSTGVYWIAYYIHNADDSVLYDTSLNSATLYSSSNNRLMWSIECADFGTPGMNFWHPGDSIFAFGSWDSAYASSPGTYGDNKNHVSFYWMFSDTLTTEDVQTWAPDDTLRVVPKPIVYQTGAGGGADDTIWIKIPNPEETRRGDQVTVYDVMGYLIMADTTVAHGTHNSYTAPTAHEVAYVARTGVYGDTTVYWQLESQGFTGWHDWFTRFAYKIVFRPDTSMVDNPDSPGFSTYYFSQNSDEIVIYQNVVGIEEQVIKYRTLLLSAKPNPFVDKSAISFTISRDMPVVIKLYDIAGNYVSTVLDQTMSAGMHQVNVNGSALPGGVYFYQISTPEKRMTGRLVKL